MASSILWASSLTLVGAAQPDLHQYAAAIHVHSTFSNGHHSVSELARFAREREIDVLILTDSFLTTVLYGLWPLDRLGIEGLNRKSRAGVRHHGLRRYLDAVGEARRQFPELVIIPGVEVTPHYSWRGSPWESLSLHDFDRHLMVLGLDEKRLHHLPVIHNATWGNTSIDWLRLLVPLMFLVAGGALLLHRRSRKIRLRYYTLRRQCRPWGISLTLMAAGLLLAWNNYPFGRLYDPEPGENGARPYQELINYVRRHSGLVYWSYPEARFPPVEAGGARMISRPHPEDLLQTDGYHGFEGIYGDEITVTLPGEIWDATLLHYLKGERLNPPFVVTGIDFHQFQVNRGRWYDLDGGQTILLMAEKSEPAVLEALRRGRNYAVFQDTAHKVRLFDFSLQTADGAVARQGSEVSGPTPVVIRAHLDWLDPAPEPAPSFRIELIANGHLVDAFDQPLPFRMEIDRPLEAGRHYFRLRAFHEGRYQVLSNPVFVTAVGRPAPAGATPPGEPQP